MIELAFFSLLVLEDGKSSEHVATIGTIYSCKCNNYVFNVSILVLYIDQLVSALADYCECNWTLYQIVIICVVELTMYFQHCLESENRRRSGLPLAMIS